MFDCTPWNIEAKVGEVGPWSSGARSAALLCGLLCGKTPNAEASGRATPSMICQHDLKMKRPLTGADERPSPFNSFITSSQPIRSLPTTTTGIKIWKMKIKPNHPTLPLSPSNRLSRRRRQLTSVLLLLLLLLLALPHNVIPVLNRYTLRHVVDLVHAHQPRRQLEHVVPERDDDELGVLRPLLDVVGDNRHLSTQHVSHPVISSTHTRGARHGQGRGCKLTFLKSSAASISSMTYSGVGL
jgi:hypothetical protein